VRTSPLRTRHTRYLLTILSGAIGGFCVSAALLAESLPDPLAAGWQGEPVCERLHAAENLRVLRCTFPPGVGHERHFHPPHFGYAVSGGVMQVTDKAGVRTVEIASGSYFTSGGVAWREALNVGDTTVQYLMIEPQ
jgi:quercetin dioxygenase-like cupin family protein